MKFTRQFDQMDCGPACIRMVASTYGKDYPISYLRTLSHLSREGVSVAGIRDALNQIGADSASFEMTLEQLRERCPLPAILHWEQNHFVVLYGIDRSRWTGRWTYRVANPAYGKHSFSEEGFSRYWLNGEKGVAIVIEPREDFFKRKSVKEGHSLVRFAGKYVWPFRWELSQSAFGMLFGMLLSLVMPFLTQMMVDEGIGMHDMGFIRNILFAQLSLFLGTFLMELISSHVSLYMSTRININILGDYLTKLLRLPMTFFDTKSMGDYQQRMGDHGRLQSFITNGTLQTFFSIVSVPFYLTIVGWYSPFVLAVYLFLTGVGMAWTMLFFRRRKAMDYEQFKINVENRNKQYELVSGITDIKLGAYEDYKMKEWHALQECGYRISVRMLKLRQAQDTGFTLIGQLRNILITCWIATEVVHGHLTLGMMMSVSSIVGLVNGPLSQLIAFLLQFQDAKISLERSEEVHLCANEDADGQTNVPLDKPQEIVLRNVTFSYTGSIGKPALQDVSLSIPTGKMTAIVGESGSGKTTLMKLLLKFYEPTQGTIFWGGKPLTDYTARSIRQASGVVMQDNFLFSDTIKHNVVLGDAGEDERLQEALSIACLDNFIQRLPLGVNTKIGAEGIGVSGGEKQRIMIARAVYKRPAYLMLDEATSSLDADNEKRITDNLARVFRNRTCIVIAHRLSTVRDADQIIVLRHGRVVEQGNHASLVRMRGYYYRLIHNQLELASN